MKGRKPLGAALRCIATPPLCAPTRARCVGSAAPRSSSSKQQRCGRFLSRMPFRAAGMGISDQQRCTRIAPVPASRAALCISSTHALEQAAACTACHRLISLLSALQSKACPRGDVCPYSHSIFEVRLCSFTTRVQEYVDCVTCREGRAWLPGHMCLQQTYFHSSAC